MDQLGDFAKPLCKAAFRVLHAAEHRRRRRGGAPSAPRVSGPVRGGVYLDLPAKLFRSGDGRGRLGARSLVKVHRPGTGAASRSGRGSRAPPLDLLKSAERPLIILGKGAGLRAGR